VLIDTGTFEIAPAIGKLSVKHPQLRFELEYTDELVDLVKKGFDLAVRVGPVRVLPEWTSIGWPVSMVSPMAPSSSARLKVTVDQILEELNLFGFFRTILKSD